jgi:hypothetical protein
MAAPTLPTVTFLVDDALLGEPLGLGSTTLIRIALEHVPAANR